ncbi:MAG TPA: hypothetical protein HA362_00130 [Nanoarchaeota archaeon]|nr:hypothetical protein [Nanoarchaeota archaeon]
MKELISNLLAMDLVHARGFWLLDTSFFVSCMEHKDREDRLLALPKIAMTSFNMEELVHIDRMLGHQARKNIREFLAKAKMTVITIDVHPGNWGQEKEFVKQADPMLLNKIHDPSDAVLLAAAIKTHSNVLTKDKHHLFTVVLENFIRQYDVKVFKELHDIA